MVTDTQLKEKGMQAVFMLSACISIIAVALICFFMFANGVPAMIKIGVGKFLSGVVWRPNNEIFGILPMILGSIYVTFLSLVLGIPTGVLTAVFMARFCPKTLYKFIKPAIDLLAGIPSVVYGFFALMVIVPLIRFVFGGSGTSLLAASIILGIMILPTIIGVSESALRAVPETYYEASLALGATHERSVFFVLLPAAKSGISAGIILGIGRAIGETMAIIMVAGNQAAMPRGLLKGLRTMTANIVLEMLSLIHI